MKVISISYCLHKADTQDPLHCLHIFSFRFLIPDRPEYCADPGNDHRHQDDPHALGKGAQPRHVPADRRKGHSGNHRDEHRSLLSCRGNDDRKEHAIKCYSQRADHHLRQDRAGGSTQYRASDPSGDRCKDRAVAVARIEKTFSRYTDAENLIRHAIGDPQSVDCFRIGRELL